MVVLTLTVLWFSAVVFALIGVYFLAMLQPAAASIGVVMSNGRARTDVRATYGGMVLGVALFFAWAAMEPARYEAGLWSILLVYGGLALGRLIALAGGEQLDRLMWSFLAIELSIVILALFPLVGF